jgi:hypothetical protein
MSPAWILPEVWDLNRLWSACAAISASELKKPSETYPQISPTF